jgi:hypothetical protein
MDEVYLRFVQWTDWGKASDKKLQGIDFQRHLQYLNQEYARPAQAEEAEHSEDEEGHEEGEDKPEDVESAEEDPEKKEENKS